MFGEVPFLTGLSYNCTAKCPSFAALCKISRENFMDIIKSNKDDY